jgi:hypothetical protein
VGRVVAYGVLAGVIGCPVLVATHCSNVAAGVVDPGVSPCSFLLLGCVFNNASYLRTTAAIRVCGLMLQDRAAVS